VSREHFEIVLKLADKPAGEGEAPPAGRQQRAAHPKGAAPARRRASPKRAKSSRPAKRIRNRRRASR
jgi:hypothetical protein